MVVQHNIPALNAHRNLGVNNSATAKNLEKLSSGLRINRSADDAAGLAISEKMRAQIRGLAMAEQNVSNGINLIQTAEGGLNETHAILQRMRELAVQASNGTYQTEDRQQIDLEVQALKSELDRIAASTSYNGINLVDGTVGGRELVSTVVHTAAGVQPVNWMDDDIAKAMGFTDENENVTVAGDKVQYVSFKIMDDGLGNPELWVSIGDPRIDATYQAVPTGSPATVTFTGPPAVTVDVNFAGNSNISAEIGSVLILDFNKTDPQTESLLSAINSGSKMLVNMNARTTTYLDPTAVGMMSVLGLDRTSELTVTADGGAIAEEYAYLISRYTPNGYEVVLQVNGNNYIGRVNGTDLEFYDDNNTLLASISDYNGATDAGVMKFKTSEADDTPVILAQTEDAVIATSASQLIFQIGANGTADQRVGLHVDNMSTANIGDVEKGLYLMDIDIVDQDNANAAIDVINAAIDQVSAQRAKLGALQNRMEHTLNNLGVAKENLTAAESTIRDTDMAKEMMEFTKNSILVQSAQAMLAQANALPQGILSLLR